MKVAFVHPPKIHENFTVSEDCCFGLAPEPSLPGALLACASQMENAVFFDLSLDSPEKLASLKPDLIVYPLAVRFKLEAHAKMTRICRDTPKIALAIPPGYMREYAHFRPNPFCVIYSEPERIFSELDAETLEDLVEWRAHSQGTAWVDDEGYHQTEPLNTCIHKIKGTDWNLVPPDYWARYYQVIYQFTRGCPHRCYFCVWGGSTVTDRTFRMRPPEQVATDLASLRKTVNRYKDAEDKQTPIELYALNAQMTTDLRWIREYHALVQDDLYRFKGNVTVHDLTREKLWLLNKSGMYLSSGGIEALTDPLLRKLNKPHTFEDIVRGIKILNEPNLVNKPQYNFYWLHLKSGFGETKKDIDETLANIKILKKRGITHSRMRVGCPIIYYKGTVMHEETPPETLIYDHRFGAHRQKTLLISAWLNVKERLIEENFINRTDRHYPLEQLRYPPFLGVVSSAPSDEEGCEGCEENVISASVLTGTWTSKGTVTE